MRARSPSLQLDQHLCFSLYRASRAMTRAYVPLLSAIGLTYPQYLVMLVLWEELDVSVTRVGERLALDSATLTPLLKRLEQQALVTRTRDTVDERVVRIRLTPEGKALRDKARKIPFEVGCQTGYDVEDRAALAKLIRLRDELNTLSARLEAAQSQGSSSGASGPTKRAKRRSSSSTTRST